MKRVLMSMAFLVLLGFAFTATVSLVQASLPKLVAQQSQQQVNQSWHISS